MKVSVEKPGTPAELVHYGVKGMKWGVRKKVELIGREKAKQLAEHNEEAKKYISSIVNQKKPSLQEATQSIVLSQKKHDAKFEPSISKADSEKHHLTDKQKKIAIGVGIGVGVTAAAVGSYYLYKHYGGKSIPHKVAAPGEHISQANFRWNTIDSKKRGWVGGYVKPESFSRGEIEIPKGSVFHRLSLEAESSFNEDGTYVTHTISDFNRYISSSEFDNRKYHVTFDATDNIRVPSMTKCLSVLRESMIEKYPDAWGKDGPTHDDVLLQFNKYSGGPWVSAGAHHFIEKLRGLGYGGIVDEMDAGVYGDSPLFLFSKAVSPKRSSVIGKDDIKNAAKNLTELQFRK